MEHHAGVVHFPPASLQRCEHLNVFGALSLDSISVTEAGRPTEAGFSEKKQLKATRKMFKNHKRCIISGGSADLRGPGWTLNTQSLALSFVADGLSG